MTELADIFRRHGPAYRAKFGRRMPPSHWRAMRDIEQCRTPVLGGSVYACPKCQGELAYSYHSCKNRACPKCQNEETTRWLDSQRALLLPVDYFMVTFTLPDEFRQVARSNQKTVYGAFFRSSAQAFTNLAAKDKHLGGLTGMMGVLQTWTRTMAYHVHIHYIVPGGALSKDHEAWLPHRYENWLVPVKALSASFRIEFNRALDKLGLLDQVNPTVWRRKWVVHCQPAGSGTEVLKYIAPYIHRIAISNNRIEHSENGAVTFRFKNNLGAWRQRSIPAEEFIRQFLQHVLPKGFIKIRYYGFLAARNRKKLMPVIRRLLGTEVGAKEIIPPNQPDDIQTGKTEPHHCQKCGTIMILIDRFGRYGHHARAPPAGDHDANM